jgi:hypothetical protein
LRISNQGSSKDRQRENKTKNPYYLNAEELHDALVVVLISVDGDKEELSLVLLGHSLGHLNLGLHNKPELLLGLWLSARKQNNLDYRYFVSVTNYQFSISPENVIKKLQIVTAAERGFFPCLDIFIIILSKKFFKDNNS